MCAESLNGTDPEEAEDILRNLGTSICTVMNYTAHPGVDLVNGGYKGTMDVKNKIFYYNPIR